MSVFRGYDQVAEAEREASVALGLINTLRNQTEDAQGDLDKAREFAESAGDSAAEIAQFLLKDTLFKSSVIEVLVSQNQPTYDSDWVALKKECLTEKLNLSFETLPTRITAYYKLGNGSIFPWGLNQYGDAHQSNGVLLDFDGKGTLYLRTPCGSRGGNNVTHIGSYRNRDNSGNEGLFNRADVEFRVILWE